MVKRNKVFKKAHDLNFIQYTHHLPLHKITRPAQKLPVIEDRCQVHHLRLRVSCNSKTLYLYVAQ